jgi:acyl-Coa thioesterase superfamily protein/acyl-CoA thioesterase superfamily protein
MVESVRSRAVAGFEAATSVVVIDGGTEEGRWTCRAELDAEWRVMTKPNGGYLLALVARAALAGGGSGRGLPPHPLAVSAHFLRAPDVGPADVDVQLLRDGTRMTVLRATLLQGGQCCVEALVTLGTLQATGAAWYDGVPVPGLPDEANCVRADGSRPELPVPMLSVVEERLDPATIGWAAGRPGGSPELRGWLRHADGREPDALALLQAVDALPPATFDLGTTGWVPTLELTAYVRALPAPGPLVLRQRARLVDGGLVDEECDVWDSRGRLVATGHQLAGLRVPEGPPVPERR